MGSSLSAIADDMDYYDTICHMLGIEKRSDNEMYAHMSEIEKAFGVRSKYDLIGAIRKKQEEIEQKAYKEGMEAFDIKELVKGNHVEFSFYRQGVFHYTVYSWGDQYTFPVPQEDIGSATLLKRDKAITFMRWIRKAILDKTLIKIKNE